MPPHGLQHVRLPCPSPSLGSLFQLMSTESVMPSSHLILCRPLLILPSVFLSIRVFSSESTFRIGWPKCWSFSFSISPSNEYSGLIQKTKPCLRLEPTWLRLKPSQNPVWDLSPPGWDSNPAKSHSTWFQVLMKLRFYISSQKEFSERQSDR